MAIDKLRSEMRIGFDTVNARFGQVQARFNSLEARFDTVDRRLATVEDRLGDEAGKIRRHIDVVAEEFKHYRQILALEERRAAPPRAGNDAEKNERHVPVTAGR